MPVYPWLGRRCPYPQLKQRQGYVGWLYAYAQARAPIARLHSAPLTGSTGCGSAPRWREEGAVSPVPVVSDLRAVLRQRGAHPRGLSWRRTRRRPDRSAGCSHDASAEGGGGR